VCLLWRKTEKEGLFQQSRGRRGNLKNSRSEGKVSSPVSAKEKTARREVWKGKGERKEKGGPGQDTERLAALKKGA